MNWACKYGDSQPEMRVILHRRSADFVFGQTDRSQSASNTLTAKPPPSPEPTYAMLSPDVRKLTPSAIIALVAFSALAPLALAAQGPSAPAAPAAPARTRASSHEVPVPTAVATERTSAITIDGKLDDAAWQSATPVTELTQFDPDEGQPASERTEVRFLFDGDALYVGAKMYDKNGRAGVKTNLVRRDDQFNSDYFGIVLDGYHDHLSRAFFQVNPSGSKTDMIGIGNGCCDPGWDPVWEAAARIDDDGWSAEMRIPLSQLRFASDNEEWGLQIHRWIHRRNEFDQWAFWKKTESGGPNRFGHLEGLKLRDADSRHIELLPYVVGKGSYLQHAAGDPFNPGNNQAARVGLDLKYLLTSNLSLSATFNPDFGQVEVDPAVVNLSAFESFFPEKRPFFIEGAGIFGFGGFNCFFCSNVSSLQAFYSRRIGRAPTGADLAYGAGQYADVPDATFRTPRQSSAQVRSRGARPTGSRSACSMLSPESRWPTCSSRTALASRRK